MKAEQLKGLWEDQLAQSLRLGREDCPATTATPLADQEGAVM